MRQKRESYHTPTRKILARLWYEKNPVTRAVLRNIVGNRIDRASAGQEQE